MYSHCRAVMTEKIHALTSRHRMPRIARLVVISIPVYSFRVFFIFPQITKCRWIQLPPRTQIHQISSGLIGGRWNVQCIRTKENPPQLSAETGSTPFFLYPWREPGRLLGFIQQIHRFVSGMSHSNESNPEPAKLIANTTRGTTKDFHWSSRGTDQNAIGC